MPSIRLYKFNAVLVRAIIQSFKYEKVSKSRLFLTLNQFTVFIMEFY